MKKQRKKKQTKWMKHLLDYKKKHPGKTLRECMVKAKPSYNPNRK